MTNFKYLGTTVRNLSVCYLKTEIKHTQIYDFTCYFICVETLK
jgi:hypothetical protein